MKRREFLGTALSVGAALPIALQSSSVTAMGLDKQASDVDVLVVGGGLTGCLAALAAAEEGAKVLLIEPRTYLGREITATLRPWLNVQNADRLPPDLKRMLVGTDRPVNTDPSTGEMTLAPAIVKQNLLNRLREAGVDVLFMSYPAGLLRSERGTEGVVVGNKAGLQAIPAKTVIDATENAALLRMAGVKLDLRKRNIYPRRTVEFFSVSELRTATISVDAKLGIPGNTIFLHKGNEEWGQYYVEFPLEISVNSGDFRERMAWEIKARQTTIALCQYLKTHEKAFEKAVLGQTSSELWCPPYFSVDRQLADGTEADVTNRSYENLFYTDQTAFTEPKLNEQNLDETRRVADKVGAMAARRSKDPTDTFDLDGSWCSFGRLTIFFDGLHVQEGYDNRFKTHFLSLKIDVPDRLPHELDCNVLVAGGGTAGACAAIAAGRHTKNVTLIENFSGLGGTGTLGGVNRYYYGYRDGFTEELDRKVDQMTKRISFPTGLRDWNIESKMMTYFEELVANDVNILFRVCAVDTVVKESRVEGVMIATPDGLEIIRSKVAIDATGDGDLVVWSGGKAVLGSERGGNVQTFNQCRWRFGKDFVGVNIDLGVIDITNPIDTSRGISIGHKEGGAYDFSPFPSVRESRHTRCEYEVNEADVLSKKRFPDTIAVGQSDYDQHDIQSSDFARMGFIPYHKDEKTIRIPYRSCLPKGIDDLLVTGKAFGATRDASCFMRMQPSLQNKGYAVGLAAALAVEGNKSLRNIDIQELQKLLLEKRIIRDTDVAPPESELQPPAELVRSIENGDEDAFVSLLCSPKHEVLPLLEDAYKRDTGKDKLLTAMALAWFGSNSGVDTLLNELHRLKDEKQSSSVDSHNRPIGGFTGTPNTYWRVNQLIVLLGLAGDRRAVDSLSGVVRDTDAGGPPRSNPRLHWRRIPNYDRILSLCFSLERLADRKAAGALESLVVKPHIGGYVAKQGIDGDQNYMSAYLEVVVARTLARCGGRKGLQILADYVDDIRSVLADHAYKELREITGSIE